MKSAELRDHLNVASLVTRAGVEAEDLLSLITGYWMSQSVYAAVRTGVVEALHEQPRSPLEIARAAGCDEAAVSRLLRYLCGLGVVQSDGSGRYTATAVGELLRDGSGFRELVLLYGDEFYRAWTAFDESVRGGGTAYASVFGIEHFDHFARDEDSARRFDQAMAACANLIGDGLSESFNFSRASRIIDVGGGSGSLLKRILRTAPAAHGVVVDRDHVAAQCERELEGHEFADRMSVVGTDFFDVVPDGGDLYLLCRVLHDWDDEHCARLLQVVRTAMRDDAELLIVERLLPDNGGTSLASRWDMQMLAITGGRERTRSEYETVLRSGGFTLCEVKALPLDTFLLISRPE